MKSSILRCGLLTAAVTLAANTSEAVVINELYTSTLDGANDNPWYVELHGLPLESLSGLSLVIVDQTTGDEGAVLASVDLDTLSLGFNGKLLVGNTAVSEATQSTEAVFSVTVDAVQAAVTHQDLSNASATLLVQTSTIPGAGTGPLTGSETVVDGLDINVTTTDFGTEPRSGTPVTWTDVPLFTTTDGGFAFGGYYRTVEGTDTNAEGDWSTLPFVFGSVLTAGDCTDCSPTAASASPSVVVNEMYTSTLDGTDDNPWYVELFGAPSASLDGLTLAVIDQTTSDEGAVLAAVDLAGQALGANGYYLIGNTSATEATQSTEAVFGVTVDLAQESVVHQDLSNASAVILIPTAAIPNSGAGPLAGTEGIVDGLDINVTTTDFGTEPRSVSPVALMDVPLFTTTDGGFAFGGYSRTTDGVDTDAEGDWSTLPFVFGSTITAGDCASCSPTSSTAGAAVRDWAILD